MGTQMLSCAESPVHMNWKEAILNARETDTVFLNQRHSPALRALRTERSERLADMDENIFGEFGDPQKLYFGGDMNAAVALSGQVAGRIEQIRPIAEIIGEAVKEFSETIDRLSNG